MQALENCWTCKPARPVLKSQRSQRTFRERFSFFAILMIFLFILFSLRFVLPFSLVSGVLLCSRFPGFGSQPAGGRLPNRPQQSKTQRRPRGHHTPDGTKQKSNFWEQHYNHNLTSPISVSKNSTLEAMPSEERCDTPFLSSIADRPAGTQSS